MKLKHRPGDFRVRELLREGFIIDRGPHRVYRVKKRKLTSIEAARALSELAGARSGDVAMAGLKDRQGVTEQTMTLPHGKPVAYRRPELTIETLGSSAEAISSEDTLGNHFDIIVRDLTPLEERHAKAALDVVREHGLANYFDEQRFGNLRHGQGWIALDLAHGRFEAGLKRLLTAVSKFDNQKSKSFKSALYRHWGKWGACRDIAGRFGEYHSLFEHLKRSDGDFAGAFRFVASRIRLIHLYAYQSHVWNRALALAIEHGLDRRGTLGLGSPEGRLVFAKSEYEGPPDWRGELSLPGPGLEGVELADQRALFAKVLERDKLTPETFRIDGVPGFAFKAEPRAVIVVPRDLRVKRPDSAGGGASGPRSRSRGSVLELSFGLPRGSYATLVVRRLLGSAHRSSEPGAAIRAGARGGGRHGAGRGGERSHGKRYGSGSRQGQGRPGKGRRSKGAGPQPGNRDSRGGDSAAGRST